jgi:hypothetical protein
MPEFIHPLTLSQFTLQRDKTCPSFLSISSLIDLIIVVTAFAYAIRGLSPQSDSPLILIHLRSLRLMALSLHQLPSPGLRLQLPSDTLCYSTRMPVHRPMGHIGCVRRFRAICSRILSLDRTLTSEASFGSFQCFPYINIGVDGSFY